VTPAAEPQAAAHPGAPVPPLAPSPVPFARPASSIDASGRAESPRPPAQPTNSSARSDVAALPQAERPMAHSAPAAIPMPARPPTVARDNSPPPPRLSLPPAPGPDPVAMPRAMAVLPSDSHSQPLSSPRIADAPRQPATPQVGQPVAPIPLSRPQAPTSPTAAEAISPVASRPAPEAPTADPPAFAEIHLDGQALGRWLTRQLEARLNRPPAGTTGFDPRMTPTWPGAPTGN
jgi:hypothetical protein